MPLERQKFAHQIMNGLFWAACGKGAQGILQLLVLIILARLILPRDFGVVSAAMIVIGFSEVVTELGMGAAIVQRENLEPRHIKTAFSVSLILSVISGLLIYGLSPFLAAFFASEQVEGALKLLAWLFPLRGLASMGNALAQREMQFRWLAAVESISFFVGYLLFGVFLAVLGYGVLALVVASLTASGLKAAIFLVSRPPIGFMPERRAFVELLFFGGGHTAARVSNYVALQGDNMVVARTLDLYSLGIYGRSYQLMSVPASGFGQVLDNVLFPAMSKMQSDRKQMASAYFLGIALVALVMLPASVIGIILAPEIVLLLLGPNWTEVVLPFRILMIGLLMRTSYKLSDSLARAAGAVYARAWRQMIYAGLVIGGAWLGHFWGVAGVASGVLLAVAVNFLLMGQMSITLIGGDWNEFLRAHRSGLICSIATGIAVYPLVYGLRRMELAPVFVVALSALFLILMGTLAFRFLPKIFLGSEGLWLIDVLVRRIPERYGSLIRPEMKTQLKSY